MKASVEKLDSQIKFMREQASRLRDLCARPGNRWAEQNATKMEQIAEVLAEVRRDLQMTGMNGKRIDEAKPTASSEPPLDCDGFVSDPHSRFCDRCGYPEREHKRARGL